MWCAVTLLTFINLVLEMILTLVHMCETAAAWQETEKPHSWKQPLYVPQPSPLARHDNAAYPSFFFLDPVRERHLFYYQQRKRSPPSSRLVFLWRRVEGWGKTQSGGNAEEKLLLISVWFCGGKCASTCRCLSLSLYKICTLDVLKIYSWSSCPSYCNTSLRGVSPFWKSLRSWSVGSRKG